MHLRGKWACAAATLAVAALLALGPPARADFVVVISEYSGANGTGTLLGQLTIDQNYGAHTTSFTTGGTNSASITNASAGLGNGSISLGFADKVTGTTVGGSAAAPGDALTATGPQSGVSSVDATQSTTNVTIGKGVGSIVITEAVNALGPLTGPVGIMTSTLSNSLLSGGGSDTLVSYFDQSNSTTAGTGINPTGTQGPLSSGTPPGNTASATVAISGSSPFAINNIFTFNGSQGAAIHDTATTTITVTPEPASLALWLSGLPVLGLVRYWRRRQRGGPLAVA